MTHNNGSHSTWSPVQISNVTNDIDAVLTRNAAQNSSGASFHHASHEPDAPSRAEAVSSSMHPIGLASSRFGSSASLQRYGANVDVPILFRYCIKDELKVRPFFARNSEFIYQGHLLQCSTIHSLTHSLAQNWSKLLDTQKKRIKRSKLRQDVSKTTQFHLSLVSISDHQHLAESHSVVA
ncbi:hypothetical protein BDZ45DRAFT_458594 [Acephala macrosclerotiorum]|nr:hypothetical protein BDZ45DRAFT_458594 [Acephala macrosclerotiorum]